MFLLSTRYFSSFFSQSPDSALSPNPNPQPLSPPFRFSIPLFLLHSAIYHIGLLGIPDVITNFYLVSLGYGAEEIGGLLSLSRVAGLLTGLPIGWYAGRLGERRILIVGTAGAAVSLGLMVLFPSYGMIALSRFLLGAFYGAGQIATAPLMIKLVGKARTTGFFALANIISMGTSALGSFIGGALPAFLVGAAAGSMAAMTAQAYGWSLIVCMAITLASIIPLGFIVLPTDAVANITGRTMPHLNDAPWRTLILLSMPMLLFGFTGGLTFPFYNLFFRETFAITDEVVGQILGYGWLGMALIPMLNPFWERRLGRSLALAFLMTAGGIAFFGLSRAGTLALSIPFYIAAISIRNCMQPLYQPLLLDTLPPAQHNLGSSMSLVLWNVGWFAATALSGAWQVRYGFGFIFQIVAVGVFINGWLVFAIFRRVTPRWTPQPAPDHAT